MAAASDKELWRSRFYQMITDIFFPFSAPIRQLLPRNRVVPYLKVSYTYRKPNRYYMSPYSYIREKQELDRTKNTQTKKEEKTRRAVEATNHN